MFNDKNLDNTFKDFQKKGELEVKNINLISEDIRTLELNLKKYLFTEVKFEVNDSRLINYEPVYIFWSKGRLQVIYKLDEEVIQKNLIETKVHLRIILSDHLINFLKEIMK